jgi:hypothetical protein
VTLHKVEEQVVKLEGAIAGWSQIDDGLRALKVWLVEIGPAQVANLLSSTSSPEEKLTQSRALKQQLSDRFKELQELRQKARFLLQGKLFFYF